MRATNWLLGCAYEYDEVLRRGENSRGARLSKRGLQGLAQDWHRSDDAAPKEQKSFGHVVERELGIIRTCLARGHYLARAK